MLWVAGFALAILIAGVGSAWLLFGAAIKPSSDIQFKVTSGDSLRPVLQRLEKLGVIRFPRLLYVYGRIIRTTGVKRGIYFFDSSKPMTMSEILARLNKGDILQGQITIIEGHDRWQVRDQLVRNGWLSAAEFDAFCDDLAFLQAHQIPGPSCEGYLAPDTYRVALQIDPGSLFAIFFDRYRQRFESVSEQGDGPLHLTERQLVTLASIVEKETGQPSERARIACVFYNRLRKKPAWKLQTDPTVIYARKLSEEGFDGNIRRKDLQMNHPYNTYAKEGLPPGPIANPGRAALEAVISPIECRDYFFVAMDACGSHQFCPDIACHSRAVQHWQLNRRKRK